MQLASVATKIDRDMQREFGFSLGEYRIMAVLEDGALPQSQLSDRTRCSASAVSRWLKQLVRDGCATRHCPTHDRRERVANITRRGINQLRRIRPWLAEELGPMASELAPESEYLLVRLQNNLARLLTRSPGSDK